MVGFAVNNFKHFSRSMLICQQFDLCCRSSRLQESLPKTEVDWRKTYFNYNVCKLLTLFFNNIYHHSVQLYI